MTQHSEPKPSGAFAGVILLLASVAAVIFVTHHPTLGSTGYETIAQEAVAEAAFNGLIHGALIIFALGYYYALSVFSERLGITHPAIRAAQLAITIATATMVGAALVSGFIVPDTAAHFTSVGDDAMFRAQLRTLGAANQVLAKTGTIAYGAAVFFWSVRLIASQGVARAIGVIGCLAGAALVVGIFSKRLALDVHGITVVLIIIGLWFSAIGALMIFRKL